MACVSIILVLLCTMYCIKAFMGGGIARIATRQATSMMTDKWPGDRPPVPLASFLTQYMDASWGRGKFRTEVWSDDVNPMNNWWEVYAPSEEEQQAVAGGYDFGDVEAWCKERGLDYEAALEQYQIARDKAVKEYEEAEKAKKSAFDSASFAQKQDEFMALQKQAFEVAFRLRDNRLQGEKNQPSLDDEDTGVQWKND